MLYLKSICVNLLFSTDHIKLPKQNIRSDFFKLWEKIRGTKIFFKMSVGVMELEVRLVSAHGMC